VIPLLYSNHLLILRFCSVLADTAVMPETLAVLQRMFYVLEKLVLMCSNLC